MRKFLIIFISLILFLSFVPLVTTSVSAQDHCLCYDTDPAVCKEKGIGAGQCNPSNCGAACVPGPTFLQSIGALITRASGIVTPLSIVGFIFCIIYAGWVRMTATGDPEKEKRSMKIAISAAVGFAIIALAPVIVQILINLFGVEKELYFSP